MPFHVHRAERADRLVGGLADLLAHPAGDPFDEELVIVPARGIERWLSQQLGHRLGVSVGREDGVCAGVRFTSPRSLMAELLGTKDDDPWDPDRLVWPLLEVIDASLGEPWCRTLARHLGEEHTGVERELRRGRRYGVARRIAGLFSAYAAQRPGMLAEWAGLSTGSLSTSSLSTSSLSTGSRGDLAWQAELYRRLLGRVDAPAPDVRLAATVERLRAEPDAFDLPERISFLGHTRLASTDVMLLDALAAHRDVHLWLPHPSPSLWDALAPAAAAGPVRRADDPTPIDAPNPLLISLGRDSRELQRTLHLAGDVHDEHLPATEQRPDTLLGWLQDDLVGDRSGADGRVHDARDRSIQVHACHGKARQVDVLREVLVGLLEDDPTLEPRDILVMCPDIETYAPLIHAAFGLAGVVDDGHPAHQLRVRLADRGSASTNPLLQVATSLLTLAGSGRLTATEVLDLIAMAPVRHRFGLSDDDLEQIARWVDRSGVRWGLDAVHREPFGLDDLVPNTWQFGVDRVLVGAAVAEQRGRWIKTVLPLDDVSSGDIDLAGRLAEIVDRLRDTIDRMTLEQPVSDWVQTLRHGVLGLASVPYRDEWQVDQLERELARLDDAARGSSTPLRLAEVASLLGDRLGSRPTRANFRTGTLTVCTMVPMRSVPHRVICLLGLDDGEFPRVGAVHGDDVLARDPMTGERDVRSEDRQLFLDAIMAATETLVLTYTGADERTGQSRPPAVPLGELIDQVRRTAAGADVVTHHPLQPFDRRNVIPGALVPDQPFTFDPAALAGAQATAGPVAVTEPAFLARPLEPAGDGEIALPDLVAFLAHPVKAFLRQRLDVSVLSEDDPVADDVPIELDALQKWGVGDRILRDALAGADPGAAVQGEYRRGLVPPGELGRRLLDEIRAAVGPLVMNTAALRHGGSRAVDIDVELPDGRRLVGSVDDVYSERLVTVTYSSLAAKHRLRSWVDLLALTVAHPGTPWEAHAVGKHKAGGTHAHIRPVGAAAPQLLADLVALRDAGLREPLPLPLKTSLAYAETSARQPHVTAISVARREWDPRDFRGTMIPGERDDAHHVLIWGQDAPLEDLLDTDDQTSRFATLAHRLWDPLLAAQEVSPL
ncbi:exodeoxyribonuclease V subunit gamma [Aeromicrobium wangtongii]|uniref:exodeoxyribonuclease V subunit gamma n=1 Tax=Aeromicrobium wangtongii TaxID=2969247 RepID=UPI0020178C0E|nr:exodeoxyribonuclease V subunit gamma [Aeromicrobium wangtongii]MCL3818984.1 exodeoxyribonuclease V subunit gamma [Aeromicrobium wangtongii]